MKIFKSFNLCCTSKKQSEVNRTLLEGKHIDIYALIIGDSEVGKSSIIDSMNEKAFDPNYRKSHVFDYQKFQLIDKDTKAAINFRVWELNMKYQMMTPFNKVQIVYFVFSFDNQESFCSIKKIKKQRLLSSSLEQTGAYKPIEFLIGNKADVEDKKVETKTASEFAMKNDMIYIEISCRSQEDIQKLIERSTNVFRSSTILQERSSQYTSRVRNSIL